MNEKTTAYEAALTEDGAPTMFSRKIIMRDKTVKFTTGSRSPDVYSDGSTAGGFGTVCATVDCDFTVADAWARFIAAKEVEAASLAAQLMVVQSQIKAAKANR